MKIRFWGTRGSFAMSGREFLRYGGNTTSVELVNAAGQRLLIDLGTGATELGKQLMAGEFGKGQGTLPILLSHTHLDHIQGLPFFTPFFIKGNQIRILGAAPSMTSLESTLQNQLAPHYSPLNGLENLAAGVSIDTITPGETITLPGFEVRTAAVPHGSMWTTAFRITADGKTVTYLSDVEYASVDEPLEVAVELARDADLLIHDAMHADHDYDLRRGWGHSPARAGVIVAERAGAKKLALFHHSPDATDEMIDEVVARTAARTSVPVFAAAEGEYLEI
ncbi:MAG: MBL fold metallo-hydrolase [Deltaproteobacteria bacterium]|nr:MBL fold metallo-hydrolase [Deltaproteobacteria bacterium]MDQ3301380.1 MBL fold metallo-hydrolase [Myxococcota bacterium]